MAFDALALQYTVDPETIQPSFLNDNNRENQLSPCAFAPSAWLTKNAAEALRHRRWVGNAWT